ASDRKDDIDFEPDKLGRNLGIALWAAFRPAILDCDSTALDPTKFAHASHKSSRPRSKARSTRTQKSNNWKLAGLLRGRRHGPGCRCTNDKRDEFAPSHSFPPRPKDSIVA